MELVYAKKIETEVKGGLQMGVSMKFTDLDQYLFGQGTNYEVYKKLGAHPTTYRRKKGVYFAVWAPNAQSVSVIGEFNDWEEEANPMEKVGPIGVYAAPTAPALQHRCTTRHSSRYGCNLRVSTPAPPCC